MKSLLISFSLICFVTACANKKVAFVYPKKGNFTSVSDDTIYQKLSTINFNLYYGNSVDSFLRKEKISTYKTFRFLSEPTCYLSKLRLIYGSGVVLDIELSSDMKYTNRLSLKHQWDISTVLKENIGYIKLYDWRSKKIP